MSFTQIYPGKYFQTDNGIEAEVHSVHFANVATADNACKSIVAGKAFRVLAGSFYTDTGPTDLTFKFVAGGSTKHLIKVSSTILVYPYNAAGWLQTGVGEALLFDVGAGGNVRFNLVGIYF